MKAFLKENLTLLVVVACFSLLFIQQSCNERKIDGIRQDVADRLMGAERRFIASLDSAVAARKDTALYLTRNIHITEGNRDRQIDRIRSIKSVDSLIAEWYRVRPGPPIGG